MTDTWTLTGETPFKETSINISAKQSAGTRKDFRAEISMGAYALIGTGQSLSESLRDLADKVERARVYGSEFHTDESIKPRLRRCKYCNADMFFVKTRNDKWLPTDGRQVDMINIPTQALLDKLVKPFLVLDAGGEPRLSYSRVRGLVWIPHPLVCGSNEEPPSIAALVPRWQENRKEIAAVNEQTVRDLQHLLHELEEDDG